MLKKKKLKVDAKVDGEEMKRDGDLRASYTTLNDSLTCGSYFEFCQGKPKTIRLSGSVLTVPT